MPVGIAITLRKNRMFAFLDRLINLALPRIRDFNGLNNKSFDGRGSFSMGLSESLMFPEMSYDEASLNSQGMGITIVTTAKTDNEALALLKAFQMTFLTRQESFGCNLSLLSTFLKNTHSSNTLNFKVYYL